MNKRQKKKLFKKRAGFYPPGGPDVLRFQIWTRIGMTAMRSLFLQRTKGTAVKRMILLK